MLLLVILMFIHLGLQAQTSSYSIQQLIDSTISNNHLVSIKNWQIRERMSKLKEDGIKRYPSATLGGNYQHNFSLARLNIPAGTIGSIPASTGGNHLLPEENTQLPVGEHTNYSADVSLYQPILQQAKIRTGLDIDRIDIKLSEKEKAKVIQQLTLVVQKLYYAILIGEKQMEEATLKLEIAQIKLSDAEVALAAGKAIASNLSGLQALVAEEEQNVLKLNIMIQDYKLELANVANINVDDSSVIKLQPLDTSVTFTESIDSIDTNNISTNADIEIAQLNMDKAVLGIKAARQSNLPDVGLIAGYYYQKGNPILPTTSPYIGISLRWNLQDLLSSHQVSRQHEAQLKQAEHNLRYQQQQLQAELAKAYRKVNQTKALISATSKALKYRREELKVLQDKQGSGLDAKNSIIEIKTNLIKSESDFYSAHLSYLLAIDELKNLTGY